MTLQPSFANRAWAEFSRGGHRRVQLLISRGYPFLGLLRLHFSSAVFVFYVNPGTSSNSDLSPTVVTAGNQCQCRLIRTSDPR